MKIAFDVKGTLEGPKGNLIHGLLLELQKLGHECIVWSNSLGYAVECAKNLQLENVLIESKWSMWERTNRSIDGYDVAIEDDPSQTYLAAKRIILVRDIPDTMSGILKLAQEIGESK